MEAQTSYRHPALTPRAVAPSDLPPSTQEFSPSMEPSAGYPESPMEPDDVLYPCKGCGEVRKRMPARAATVPRRLVGASGLTRNS